MDDKQIRQSRLSFVVPMLEAMLPGGGDTLAAAKMGKRIRNLLGGELREIALCCDAENGPRFHRLADDLTAIIEVYSCLKADEGEREKNKGKVSVAEAEKMMKSVADAIHAARNLSEARLQTSQTLKGPLGAATLRRFLEFALDEVLKAEFGDFTRGLKGVLPSMVRQDVLELIDRVVVRHMLMPKPGSTPLHEVMTEFKRDLATIAQERLQQQTDPHIEGLERVAPMKADQQAIKSILIEMDHPLTRQAYRITAPIAEVVYEGLMMLWEDEAEHPLLEAAEKLEKELSCTSTGRRGLALVPEPTEALLWSLCLLIGGWQPHAITPTGKVGGKLTVSTGKTGTVPQWAALLLSNCFVPENSVLPEVSDDDIICPEDFEAQMRSLAPIYQDTRSFAPFHYRWRFGTGYRFHPEDEDVGIDAEISCPKE